MSKVDILFVGFTLLLATFFYGYTGNGDTSTLPIQPSTEIFVACNNETIGIHLDGLDRRAVGNTGMAKPRQAAPPMPRSYPIKSPPKPKPTKK